VEISVFILDLELAREENSITVLFEERSQMFPGIPLINVRSLIIRTLPAVKIIVVSHEE
jgi:hypothetical protein